MTAQTQTRFDFDLSNLLPAKSESAKLMIELPDELQANTTHDPEKLTDSSGKAVRKHE